MNSDLFSEKDNFENYAKFDSNVDDFLANHFESKTPLLLKETKEKGVLVLDQEFSVDFDEKGFDKNSLFLFIDILMKYAATNKKIVEVECENILEEKTVFSYNGESYEIAIMYINGGVYSLSVSEETPLFRIEDMQWRSIILLLMETKPPTILCNKMVGGLVKELVLLAKRLH